MRNILSEYLDLSKEEKNDLWQNAIFVFDTNVLLNLYRYSSITRNKLLDAFDVLKDRIWMPYNVGVEFLKDRCGVIISTTNRYSTLKDAQSKFIDECMKALRLEGKDAEIVELNTLIEKWLITNNEKNVSVINPSSDAILDRILNLFDKKVGKPYTTEELKTIAKEGVQRYQTNTPPGYKDQNKKLGNDDNNKYGDLIIWKQILEHSKDKDIDIIFVTHDQKEDWWLKESGKTIGPRYELKKEFKDYTSRQFLMYNMDNFLIFFNDYHGGMVDQIIIDEVKSIDNTFEENRIRKSYDGKILFMQEDINIREKEVNNILLKYKNTNDMPLNVRKNYNNLKLSISNLYLQINSYQKRTRHFDSLINDNDKATMNIVNEMLIKLNV